MEAKLTILFLLIGCIIALSNLDGETFGRMRRLLPVLDRLALRRRS